uniref:Uncharacterized protein n=1 Tax=Ditylenchus dipsaci TaxID=166011 RepID=A0A915CUN3_9BILA
CYNGSEVSEASAQIFQLQKHIWQDQPLHVLLNSSWFAKTNLPKELFENTVFQCSSLTVKLSTNKNKFPLAALLASPHVLQCDNVTVISKKFVGSAWDEIITYLHHSNQSTKQRQLKLLDNSTTNMYPDVRHLWRCLVEIFLTDFCTRSYILYLNFPCKTHIKE